MIMFRSINTLDDDQRYALINASINKDNALERILKNNKRLTAAKRAEIVTERKKLRRERMKLL